MNHKEIKGKKIILREQREEDATFFAYWFNQPAIMFQCGFTEPADLEKERKYINEYHRTEDSVWFTITDLDGSILGETGLLRMFPAWHCTDLTIIIPDPEKQNKGYGTEAIRLMLDMAFQEYDMNRVSIGVVGLNTDAIRFYRKIGFKQEGIQEQGYFYNGEYSDFIMMRILRDEYDNGTCKDERSVIMGQLFESERIRFVEVSELLIDDYLAMVNDFEHVNKYISGTNKTFSREQEIEWVHKKREENAFVYSMIEKESGAFIGNIELMDANDFEGELGIAITAKKQDMGYGTEAVAALLEYEINQLGLKRIFLRTNPNNNRAIRVYEKCGFREYDRNAEHIFMEIRA